MVLYLSTGDVLSNVPVASNSARRSHDSIISCGVQLDFFMHLGRNRLFIDVIRYGSCKMFSIKYIYSSYTA